MEKLTQQEQVRRQKMQDLIDMGIDPFGSRYDRTSNSGIITSSYGDKTKEELDELQVTVKIAGRIMTKRRQGKAGFMNIQDREGQIQIYVRKDEIGDDQYEIFKKNDIGDIVGIEGTVMKTDHGQLSVRAKNYTHLSKSLRPLPEKFHGLTDVEERFRRRYVDLIMNPEAKRIALTRPKIIRAIQHYLDGQGLVEVETPVMQPILGGASARPFVTHHNTLNMDFYLRIATELPLKRLIVGGLEGVYEIGRLFRNEGMDAMHNPEFTSAISFSRASRAISRRTGSKQETVMASGVSSMIRSAPVSVSSVRMLRPSRPMMRPFISSLGSGTTLTVISATWSAAQRWMAVATISRARWSASSLARASISLIFSAVSWVTSDSTWAIR